jgi:S1-C subfamily serine protease
MNGYGPSLVVLGTTVLVLLAGPVAVKQITYHYTEAKVIQASRRLEQSTILEQMNQAYRDIAMAVEPSVVHISTEQIVQDRWGNRGSKASSGSGWIYDDRGHIVTNHHVIEAATRIEVQRYKGDIRDAQIVGSDPTTDIAVLKIQPGQLHAASRRDPSEDPVRQGDMVFAFGSPFDFRFSMSSGVISGKGRSVGVIRDAAGRGPGYENFIQVDAAINPGNSGGPLTDFRGRVIAMNTAIATGRRGGNFDDGQFAGIGLAIPVEMIEPVVQQLIENKGVVNKGYLGVTVVDRTYQIREGLPDEDFNGWGLFVARLDTDDRAYAAGLRMHDVVTHVEAERVSTMEELRDALSRLAVDEPVALQAWRYDDEAGRGQTIKLTMPAGVFRDPRSLVLLSTTESVGEELGALGYEGRGVRVAALEFDGPARAAGLHRGDIISHVNRERVETVPQLRSVISSILPGERVRLAVWRYDPRLGRGEDLEIWVKLGRLDTLALFGVLPSVQSTDQLIELGIARMTTSSRVLAGRFDMEFHEGAMLLELTPGSDLAEQVSPGATVVEVAERPVRDTAEFVEELRSFDLRLGAPVTIVDTDGRLVRLRLRIRS